LAALVGAVQAREARRVDLSWAVLAALESALAAVDLEGLRARLEAKLADWRGMLRRHIVQTRQILRKLLPDPIVLTPHDDMQGAALRGTAALGTLISGLFPGPTNLASPAGVVATLDVGAAELTG